MASKFMDHNSSIFVKFKDLTNYFSRLGTVLRYFERTSGAVFSLRYVSNFFV
uniref:Uncharacterized protein n=1 Tax=Arundo donax TaxID=35708 RepID=A0A0A8ZK53_ARUDO